MFEDRTYILRIYPLSEDESTLVRDRPYIQSKFIAGSAELAKQISALRLEQFDNVGFAQLHEPDGPDSMIWTLPIKNEKTYAIF